MGDATSQIRSLQHDVDMLQARVRELERLVTPIAPEYTIPLPGHPTATATPRPRCSTSEPDSSQR